MRYGFIVYDDLGMKYLLFDRFPEIIRNAPTNMPCESVLIFDAGMSVSSCVLIDVVFCSGVMDIDSRCCTMRPKRSERF